MSFSCSPHGWRHAQGPCPLCSAYIVCVKGIGGHYYPAMFNPWEHEIAKMCEERTREFNERMQINSELLEKLTASEAREVGLREALVSVRKVPVHTSTYSGKESWTERHMAQIEEIIEKALSSTSPPPLLGVLRDAIDTIEFFIRDCAEKRETLKLLRAAIGEKV